MILHFKGYGLLVPFVFLGCFALAEMAAMLLTDRLDYGEWVLGAAFFSTGVICWFLGRWLKRRGSLLQDLRKTQQVDPEYCLRSFFWIKMEWWGPILLVLGLLSLIPILAHISAGTAGLAAKPGSNFGPDETKVESLRSEPGGAADRGKPGRGATNRTPPSAGSGL